ncbi:hypothetical protein EON79_11285, partial [bacterium]
MLTLALALVSCAARSTAPLDLQEIDRMAQARDIEGLAKIVSADTPLPVLRTNGAYEAGRYGWHAVEFTTEAGKRFIVLTTALTGEDVGELLFLENGGKLQYIPETNRMGMSVVREDLTAAFKLDKGTTQIVAKVQVEPAPQTGTPPFAGPLAPTGYVLRLGPNFRVATVFGANGKPVSFHQAGGVIWIEAAQKADTLTLSYEGTLDKPQYAGSIDAKHIQLTNEFWYPSIARGPAPYSLVATVPNDWIAVGQGDPAPREADGKWRFEMSLPTSVWSFSAEPFKTFSRKDKNGRGYDVYSTKLTEEEMRRQTELYEPILDFYSQAFAPYPFTRWGAADVRTYGGGALEAYSFATYGSGFLPDEDAHEPSHTWWGGIMPNTYLRSFWNESFAVWSEGLYRRNAPIGDVVARREAFADLAEDEDAYGRVPIASGSCFVGPEASSLGYGKGSHVLAMLEQLVGTEPMLAGCREWIKNQPKGQPAEWEGFEATMTRLYPRLHLESFFEDWLRKPGVATVEVQSLKWAGGKLVGKMAANPRRMPLEFILVGPTGAVDRRNLDTATVGPDGTFMLPSGIGKPARVLFDPYHRALRRGDAAPSTGFFSATRGFRVYR